MTPHEKALNSINTRIERLQAALREAKGGAEQGFQFQSIVAIIGAAEALNDYIKRVGEQAKRRHAELKQTNETLGAQHAELLTSGQELLEKLKAAPTDRTIRKEIEVAQRSMAAIQKNMRRNADTLQRELAPSLAMIDQMAVNVKRLGEAEQSDVLKRLLKNVVTHVRELYTAQTMLPAQDIIDAGAWEKSALFDIDQAAGFYDAYARTGFQVILAFEWMSLAMSESPPRSAAEANQRAQESMAARLKEITARFTDNA